MPLLDVEKAAHKSAEAQAKLHEAIHKARREGLPLRDIAKAAGMSHEQIRRLTS